LTYLIKAIRLRGKPGFRLSVRRKRIDLIKLEGWPWNSTLGALCRNRMVKINQRLDTVSHQQASESNGHGGNA
jgi:hypothetical protein